MAEQIEIFRGPTALLYGSGAVGGVVNTVTNRIPEYAPDDGFEGVVELRGDTAADSRSGVLALDGGGEYFAWHLDGVSRETDDYEIPGFADLEAGEERHEEHADDLDEEHAEDREEALPGLVGNSDLRGEAFSLGGSWLRDNGFLGVSVSGFETDYGIPGHHAPHEDEEHHDLDEGDHEDEVGHADDDGDDGHEGEEDVVRVDPPVHTSSHGAFVIEQRDVASWQVSLGARLEYQQQDPSSDLPAVSDSATSFSLAGIRDLGGGHSFAVNAALAERLPVAEELYADGPHLATRTIEIGSPDLGVETSRHLDIGFRQTEGELNWNVTAFVIAYDNFIFLQDTGADDPDEELPIFSFAQQDAEFSGLEAEFFAPIFIRGESEIDWHVFADYVNGKLSNGEYLPRMPPLRYGSRIQYHDERVVAGFEITRYDDQDRTASFEEPTRGYTMVNADINWSMTTPGGMVLEVFVIGTNLSNAGGLLPRVARDVCPRA